MKGTRIGRYAIEGTLGEGGMGVVYKAYDSGLERYVAIKVMKTSTGDLEEELRDRFFREARVAAKLNHRNIVGIYELGEDHDRPFIAMEYVEGQDLKALLEQRVFIAFERKLDLITQVCWGLDCAHRNGLVHRDIKPGNIHATDEGHAKILDFGVAYFASSELTPTKRIMGTLYYISPEQVMGFRDLDGRSDLFSVGVVLYEILSGKKPFEGDHPGVILKRIASEPHQPLSEIFPAFPADLEKIVDSALEKDREKRFATCGELAGVLEKFRSRLPREYLGLRAQVASLENELVKGRTDSLTVQFPSTLNPSLFELPQAEGDESDLGNLLVRHTKLHGRMEIINRRREQLQEVAEVLDRTRPHLERGDVESCVSTLEDIIRRYPELDEARDMYQKCCSGLEHRRRQKEERRRSLENALHVAESRLKEGNWHQCIEAVSKVLELDPSQPEALEYRRRAAKALKKDRGLRWLRSVLVATLGGVVISGGLWWYQQPSGGKQAGVGEGQGVSTGVNTGTVEKPGEPEPPKPWYQQRDLFSDQEGIQSLSSSPDGRWLAAAGVGAKPAIKVWALPTLAGAGSNWRADYDREEVSSEVTKLIFIKAGERLISAEARHNKRYQLPVRSPVTIWEVPSLQELKTLWHDSPVYSMAVSADGRWLVTGGHERILRVWDVEQGRRVRSLGNYISRSTSLAFSRDGRWLIAAARSGPVAIWSTERWRLESNLVQGTGFWDWLTFSNEGRWLASSNPADRMIRVWNFENRSEMWVWRETEAKAGGYPLAFSSDDRLLAAGTGGSITLWAAGTGRKISELPGHPKGTVTGLSFTRDGSILISGASEDSRIRLWELDRKGLAEMLESREHD